MRDVRLAAVQLQVTDDVRANLDRAISWVRKAIAHGADVIALPENYAGISANGALPPCIADPQRVEESPAVAPFLAATRDFSGVLLLGGQPIDAGSGRHANAMLALRRGVVVARYDKIHRFHATMPGGDLLTEMDTTAPGARPLVVDWEGVRLGLGICYDLRFPEHYRCLARADAHILLAPSAFTFPTGAAHWELLLRARAVENQAFMLAPAQDGVHAPGRESWGHSAIIGPWGDVMAQRAHGEGLVTAVATAAELARVRTALPALQHCALGPETSADIVALTRDADAP
jgi:nitrilase